MQDRLQQLVAIKQERVRSAERMLRHAHEHCDAAADRAEQERRMAEQADEQCRLKRQAVFEAGRGGTGYGTLYDVIVRSYVLHAEAESRSAALVEARKDWIAQQAAVAQAEAAVHAASREREKALRQHQATSARLRAVRAARQEADLQDFLEIRARRKDHE